MPHSAMSASSVPRFAWLAVFVAVLAWSAIAPTDRLTWWLEVSPALVALLVLALTRERFPLTPLVYIHLSLSIYFYPSLSLLFRN